MANIERLRNVLSLIKAKPQHWAQDQWHCGTTHCFAGFAECLQKDVSLNNIEVSDRLLGQYRTHFAAKEYLKLTEVQARQLFDAENSLLDLENIIDSIEQSENEESIPATYF